MKRILLFTSILGILALNSTLSFPESSMDKNISQKDMQVFDKAREKLRNKVGLIEAIIEQYPDNPEIHQGAAELYLSMGIFEEDKTIEEYQKVIELNPEDLQSHLGMALTYWYRYKYKRGNDSSLFVEALKAGEKVDPNNAFYNYGRAYVYLTQKSESKGIREIENALKKKSLKQYWKSRVKSKIKVLGEMGFTSTEMKVNALYGAGSTDEMFIDIVHYLKNLGEEKESKGAINEAAQIYRIMVKMAKQIRSDAWLLTSLNVSNHCADIGYEGLLRYYKRLGMEKELYKVEQKIGALKDREKKEEAAAEHGLLLLSTLKSDALDRFLDQIVENGEIKALGL